MIVKRTRSFRVSKCWIGMFDNSTGSKNWLWLLPFFIFQNLPLCDEFLQFFPPWLLHRLFVWQGLKTFLVQWSVLVINLLRDNWFFVLLFSISLGTSLVAFGFLLPCPTFPVFKMTRWLSSIRFLIKRKNIISIVTKIQGKNLKRPRKRVKRNS